jgi:hypothetical protein
VRSSELEARTIVLRDQVRELRDIVGAGGESLLPPTALASLLRRIERSTREVEAWGEELRQPCALAAAQEAHQVLAVARRVLPTAASAPKGAVLLLQVRHGADLDRPGLAERLKEATLHAIAASSPTPLDVGVGVLAIEDALPYGYCGMPGAGEGPPVTPVPLLVVVRSAAELPPLPALVRAAVASSSRAQSFPWHVEIHAATLPLPRPALALLEARCVGGMARASSRARAEPRCRSGGAPDPIPDESAAGPSD